ncbi:MAG: hypothetical protein DRQ78_08460 [Epsilonproteobacteria bacterium]|nr:MAG: hypothetical protein DRQ78_08460 [Campylobacterota bacterium]
MLNAIIDDEEYKHRTHIWEDTCLLANSADMVTQLQYKIAKKMRFGVSLEDIAYSLHLSIDEVILELNQLRNSLEISSRLLQDGDKEANYDCSSF